MIDGNHLVALLHLGLREELFLYLQNSGGIWGFTIIRSKEKEQHERDNNYHNIILSLYLFPKSDSRLLTLCLNP